VLVWGMVVIRPAQRAYRRSPPTRELDALTTQALLGLGGAQTTTPADRGTGAAIADGEISHAAPSRARDPYLAQLCTTLLNTGRQT